MSAGGALFALTALSAVSTVAEGYVSREEQRYNASIAESEANLIQTQKEIERSQYQQMRGEHLSTSMANIAKAGIMPGGSAMASIVHAQKNMLIDEAIGQFDLEMNKKAKYSEAEAYRRKGNYALRNAWGGGLSKILIGGYNYSRYKGQTTKPTTKINTNEKVW